MPGVHQMAEFVCDDIVNARNPPTAYEHINCSLRELCSIPEADFPAQAQSRLRPQPEQSDSQFDAAIMYPVNYGDRCGLYLEGPSQILDIYYNSIRPVFEEGLERGYLKRLDPLTMKDTGEKIEPEPLVRITPR